MAVKLDAGDVVRRDYFMVNPFEITVKEELRGRHTPPTEQDIIEMAESLLDHGQQQPVQCRKFEGNKLLLNLGFTRMAAARLIVSGFTDSTGTERKDEAFRLKVVLSDGNDKDAFVHNIVENAHRNATSPIDDAYNQNRLRDQYGMSDVEIGRLYRYTDGAKVGRFRKLLALSPEVQALVHDGSMAVAAAIDLLELPDDQRKLAITAASANGDGKVSGSAIREQVREHILNDDNPESAEATGKRRGRKKKKKSSLYRSMRDIKAWCKRHIEKNADENEGDEGTKAFCESLLAFVLGEISERQMDNALNRVIDYERS